MITLVAACLVAVVFLRAFAGYLRGHDPVQRDITLIFVPTVAICANAVYREVTHRPLPAAMSIVSVTLLLLQPS